MAQENKLTAWILVAAAVICVIIFSFFLERYHYYDFSAGKCTPSIVRVDLIGTFDPARPNQRGNPYYLRVDATPQEGWRGGLAIPDKIKLISASKTKEINLLPIGESGSTNKARPVAVYLADSIDLTYEDYQISGTLIAGPESDVGDVPFTCALVKNYSSEWRVPLWDALMSV